METIRHDLHRMQTIIHIRIAELQLDWLMRGTKLDPHHFHSIVNTGDVWVQYDGTDLSINYLEGEATHEAPTF